MSITQKVTPQCGCPDIAHSPTTYKMRRNVTIVQACTNILTLVMDECYSIPFVSTLFPFFSLCYNLLLDRIEVEPDQICLRAGFGGQTWNWLTGFDLIQVGPSGPSSPLLCQCFCHFSFRLESEEQPVFAPISFAVCISTFESSWLDWVLVQSLNSTPAEARKLGMGLEL